MHTYASSRTFKLIAHTQAHTHTHDGIIWKPQHDRSIGCRLMSMCLHTQNAYSVMQCRVKFAQVYTQSTDGRRAFRDVRRRRDGETRWKGTRIETEKYGQRERERVCMCECRRDIWREALLIPSIRNVNENNKWIEWFSRDSRQFDMELFAWICVRDIRTIYSWFMQNTNRKKNKSILFLIF